MTTRETLAERLAEADVLQIMAAHSPLSARLAEEAGFDGVWASGFELSALFGLPDVSLITMTQHLDMVRAMAEACLLPVIADVDTGFGNALNVIRVVNQYEGAGAAAVVIEDKVFPKVTSLLPGGRQELVRVDEFTGKLAAAVDTRRDQRFLIIARTEALIAGLGQNEALARAHAYDEAGADLILVHSRQRTAAEIRSFVLAWDGRRPLVVVPTSYPDLTVAEIASMGKVRMVIFGNHAIRAAVHGMQQVFARIRAEGGSRGADEHLASVDEIFRLQGMERVRAHETKYVR